MAELLAKLAPVVGLFVLGYIVKRAGVFAKADAGVMLRAVVNLGIPALILLSFSRIPLTAELAWLPLAAALTILLTYPAARWAGHALRLPRQTLGVVIVGPMIMNLSLLYPYVYAVWGEEGFARLAIFDVGNALLALTLVYALAARHGERVQGMGALVRRVAGFPPLWALMFGLVLNFTGYHQLPTPLAALLETLGGLMMPLLMLALGIYFEPRLTRPRALLAGVLLRAGLGLTLGLLWVNLFNLQGLERAVVLLGTLAPVGFTTLVYAHQEGLDDDFAAALASVSLLFALLYLPLALVLLM